MLVSLFNQFGALNSPPIFNAIEKGLSEIGISYDYHNLDADVAVIWSLLWNGRMLPNKDVWDHFKDNNKPVIVVEVGALHRNYTWKLSIHTWSQPVSYGVGLEFNRLEKLKLLVKPWRTRGNNILIVTQQSTSEQWNNQPSMHDWVVNTIHELRKYTQRPIIVRPHPREKLWFRDSSIIVVNPKLLPQSYDSFDFEKQIENAWAIINWNSSPGIQAILNGIPAFTGPTSLASPVANLDLSQIENPACPNRDSWLNFIAHTEWTIDEISGGIPLERLLFVKNCETMI
jgi:hypothetical protein